MAEEMIEGFLTVISEIIIIIITIIGNHYYKGYVSSDVC